MSGSREIVIENEGPLPASPSPGNQRNEIFVDNPLYVSRGGTQSSSLPSPGNAPLEVPGTRKNRVSKAMRVLQIDPSNNATESLKHEAKARKFYHAIRFICFVFPVMIVWFLEDQFVQDH